MLQRRDAAVRRRRCLPYGSVFDRRRQWVVILYLIAALVRALLAKLHKGVYKVIWRLALVMLES